MRRFGEFISKHRIMVIVVATLLLIPSIYGIVNTNINYDILSYLPEDSQATIGQSILDKDFSSASSSMLVVEDMDTRDVLKLKEDIKSIDGIENVMWIDDVADITIPKEFFPKDVEEMFYSENSTILLISFTEESLSEKSQEAMDQIRKVANKQCFLSGTAAIAKDTKDLADKETPFYVLIAVALSIVVLSLTMKSAIIPFIFLIGIGYAVLYNLGSNLFLGQISYITKALAAVLQLGVTMDYSIFLLHRYDEEKEKFDDKVQAMAEAISKTIAAISGSSLTTIAGFIALCVMELTLGKDIGIVMAKGVILGVLSTITILPALILVFDKPIHKFSHKTILPEFNKTASLVTRKYKVFVAIFIIAFIPSIVGNINAKVYYNLDRSLPDDLPSIIATNKLKDEFHMTTTHFLMVNDQIPSFKLKEMIGQIEQVDGVVKVLASDKYVGPMMPEEFIPSDVLEIVQNNGRKLMMINSKYKAATNEENAQIDKIINIAKSYDTNALLAGEGPLTKDLIETSDRDFKMVNIVSIISIFFIIALVFFSVSIPVILVLSIELAIFINMGIPYYTGTVIPFVASIVIGCIQLGATVDYAILLTTRFKEEINNGFDKFSACELAVKESSKSIVTSALSFFAATFGVGLISDLEMIKSLCFLMARGAIVSMLVIIFVLPSILIISEKLISVTTKGWNKNSSKDKIEILENNFISKNM